MRAKYGLISLLLGLILEALALIFKFEYWPLTPVIVITGMLLKIVGLVVLGWKVLRWPGFQDFLER